MSPIDRLTSRNLAFETLGVAADATRMDIRQAYRMLAFKKHPDQHPECGDEFSRITEAYRFICDHADELGIVDGVPANDPEPVSGANGSAVTPRRVSRPTLQATEEEFDAQTQADCEAHIEDQGGEGTWHIAKAVYRMGRNLTYYVATPLTKGRNEVVLPTGMLVDSRKTLPKIVAFDYRDATAGCFELPEDVCAAHFPGARKIQIRFASA